MVIHACYGWLSTPAMDGYPIACYGWLSTPAMDGYPIACYGWLSTPAFMDGYPRLLWMVILFSKSLL
jgi:hypothetical protein